VNYIYFCQNELRHFWHSFQIREKASLRVPVEPNFDLSRLIPCGITATYLPSLEVASLSVNNPVSNILPRKIHVITIPCSIGEVNVGKALIDLGASINLMPLSMCRRLGELEIMPTRMTLQLADCSITKPYGVIEDVLVRVKHFIFPQITERLRLSYAYRAEGSF